MYKQGVQGFKYFVGIRFAGRSRDARRSRLRAQHPRRRIERGDAGQPCLFRRQRRLRHLARPPRPGAARRRSATSRSTTTCARAWTPAMRFNIGVVYLPPAGGARRRRRADPRQPGAARRSSSSPRRSRCTTRARSAPSARANGIDIFGANCLGVADAWNQVRIGGALGGDNPDETLRQGLDRDLLQLRQLHHHHRAVPRHRRLGHDDADLERQGRLHPLRRARVRLRARQRRAQQGGGAVRRAGRLLRARPRVRPSRSSPAWSAAGRPSSPAPSATPAPWPARATTPRPRNAGSWRCFGVDGLFTPERPGVLGQGRGGHQHRPHPAGADRGDGAERHRAGLRARGQISRSSPGSATTRGCALPPELDLPVVEAMPPYDAADRRSYDARSARSSRASR